MFKENSITMFALCVSVCLIAFSWQQGSAGESISAQKCKEYGKLFKDSCNERVFLGGREAKLGEFPYMAALKFKTDEKLELKCTGVLISKNYVVAPAFCLVHRDLGSVNAVTLGQIDINEKTPAPSVQEIKVLETKIHPDYSPRNKSNVIGLIKLEKDVEFNKNVHPICLNEIDIKADKLMASGWNQITETNDRDQYVAILLKNMLTIYSQEECKKVYSTSKRTIISDADICAGTKKDNCDAQPIGILQVENKDVKCMDSLVGIVNYGKGFCGGNSIPDVYTKIKPYVPWIESIVWA